MDDFIVLQYGDIKGTLNWQNGKWQVNQFTTFKPQLDDAQFTLFLKDNNTTFAIEIPVKAFEPDNPLYYLPDFAIGISSYFINKYANRKKEEAPLLVLPKSLTYELKRGGPGSGFFGHRGRPGKVGGSLPRAGVSYVGGGVAALVVGAAVARRKFRTKLAKALAEVPGTVKRKATSIEGILSTSLFKFRFGSLISKTKAPATTVYKNIAMGKGSYIEEVVPWVKDAFNKSPCHEIILKKYSKSYTDKIESTILKTFRPVYVKSHNVILLSRNAISNRVNEALANLLRKSIKTQLTSLGVREPERLIEFINALSNHAKAFGESPFWKVLNKLTKHKNIKGDITYFY